MEVFLACYGTQECSLVLKVVQLAQSRLKTSVILVTKMEAATAAEVIVVVVVKMSVFLKIWSCFHMMTSLLLCYGSLYQH